MSRTGEMDNLVTSDGGYWWLIVMPFALMVFVWLFRGRGIRWVVLAAIAGAFFFTFGGVYSSGAVGAFRQIVGQVIDIVRRFGTSLF